MPDNKKLLVAVDGSPTSRRTVNYVADIVGGKHDIIISLLHLELPPRMLEWGGSEDSEVERRTSSERAAAYEDMERHAIHEGRDLLQSLQKVLTERKIDVEVVLIQFEEPLDPHNITDHILNSAEKRDCGTVVVGRHAFSGLKRLFGHHVADELVRKGKGVAIWIVE